MFDIFLLLLYFLLHITPPFSSIVSLEEGLPLSYSIIYLTYKLYKLFVSLCSRKIQKKIYFPFVLPHKKKRNTKIEGGKGNSQSLVKSWFQYMNNSNIVRVCLTLSDINDNFLENFKCEFIYGRLWSPWLNFQFSMRQDPFESMFLILVLVARRLSV